MDDLIKIIGRLLAVLAMNGTITTDQKDMILGKITAEEYLEKEVQDYDEIR